MSIAFASKGYKDFHHNENNFIYSKEAQVTEK